MRSFSLLRRRHIGFLGLLCCGFSLFAQAGEIKGVAVYRERIALTPSARLEVLLEEVPAHGQTATLIADLQLEAPGQPPIAFSLPFDDARIVPERHYQIIQQRCTGPGGARREWHPAQAEHAYAGRDRAGIRRNSRRFTGHV